MRPRFDIGLLAWCQILAEAGVAHHMSGGQVNVPMVFTMLHGLRGGGVAAEIMAIINENLFGSLSSPVKRLSRPNVLVPASPILENCLETTPEIIVTVAREVIANSTR